MMPGLNRKLWGLHPRKLTIIGARPGIGKSAFAAQVALDISLQKIPVVFVSLEMAEEDLIERLFCLQMRIDNAELLKGNFKQYANQWKEFEEKLDSIPLVITDMLGRTWQEINTYVESLETKPRVIIIDHVQEAKGANSQKQKDVIDEYLKNLRVLAVKNDIALVMCSQVNRTSQDDESKEPQLHQLKATGCLEEIADIVILLHWPYKYSKNAVDMNKYKINVAKLRNGRTGWCDIKYFPESYRFEDAPLIEPKFKEIQQNVGWTDD